MEAMLVVFFGLLGWVGLSFFAAGIAGGSDNWREEEHIYERFHRPVQAVREVHREEPTPAQTIKTTVTVANSPENAAVSSHHPSETILVRSVMVKTPYYCRENQSNDDALEMMRELDLPYLPVLDSNQRVVGVVSMRDLMRSKEQKDPPPSGK
jgi:CBS domain-containing protein